MPGLERRPGKLKMTSSRAFYISVEAILLSRDDGAQALLALR